ncbi:hypothetical protein HN011_000784 [Eciton burchellii]|nr:hypothetical protein HN011_000784 [Eciton burchellii]
MSMRPPGCELTQSWRDHPGSKKVGRLISADYKRRVSHPREWSEGRYDDAAKSSSAAAAARCTSARCVGGLVRRNLCEFIPATSADRFTIQWNDGRLILSFTISRAILASMAQHGANTKRTKRQSDDLFSILAVPFVSSFWIRR